jgi:hypothetical protein
MLEIIELIKNGKRSDAMNEIKNSGILLEDVFEELLNKDMAADIIKMYRIAIYTKYLVFKKD